MTVKDYAAVGLPGRHSLAVARRPRPVTSLIVALFLVGCGTSEVAPTIETTATETTATETTETEPTATETTEDGGDEPPITAPPPDEPPVYAGLESYERRCRRLDTQGAFARVVFDPRIEMTRGDTNTVNAAVTLGRSVPPDEIIRREGAVAEPGVVVSCLLRAELTASKYEFEIDPTGWVERSLQTTDTARWSWYVTPKIGGANSLVLKVRPIVKIRPEDSAAEEASVSEFESNVLEFETSAHVDVPWIERPQETMARLAGTFKVAEELVTALTALVAALIALGATLGIRRFRQRKAEA